MKILVALGEKIQLKTRFSNDYFFHTKLLKLRAISNYYNLQLDESLILVIKILTVVLGHLLTILGDVFGSGFLCNFKSVSCWQIKMWTLH